MAAATNDLNSIIKDTATQMPQCMMMVDQIVKIISSAGQYDIKKLKSNIKNFKKLGDVVNSYCKAVESLMKKLSRPSGKERLAQLIGKFTKMDVTKITGAEKNVMQTGFAVLDNTTNVVFTIQKMLTSMLELVDGKNGKLKMNVRKFKRVKKLFLKGIDIVFEVIDAVTKKIESMKLNIFKQFDIKVFEKVTQLFESIDKTMKRLLSFFPTMSLVIIASPLIIISMIAFVFIINIIFFIVGRIKPRKLLKAYIGIWMLNLLFAKLGALMIKLVIFALVMPLVIMASMMVVLGLAKLSIALFFIFTIIWVLQKMIRAMSVIKGIFYVSLVIFMVGTLFLMFFGLAIVMLALQTLVDYIKWGPIFSFLLMIIVMIVLFTAIGWIAQICMPIIAPALIAVFLMVAAITIIVALLFITALMLRSLQYMYLDADLIKENVQIVISTALMVIASIFTPTDEEEDGGKSKPWYKQLLMSLGKGVQLIIEAILAVAFIALIFVAITLILLIAAELLLLQKISFDSEAIETNVQEVIDTAMMVVNLVLYNSKEKPKDDGGKPWYKKLFGFIGGRLFQLIEVILAVVFLALSFVAITLVLLIAGELRLLQMISFNAGAIEANVETVLNTAQLVIDKVFQKDEKEDDPSKKGFFQILLENLGMGSIVQIITAIMAIAFLALILVAILLIMFIAKTLEYIQNLVLNKEMIVQNLTMVIDTANLVVSSIFDSTDDKPEDASSKGFFQTILEFLGLDGILQIIEAVMAIAYLALILVSIYIIKYIAETLIYIEQLHIDEGTIQQKVQSVIKAAKCVINAVFQKDNTKPQEGKGIFRKLLRMILPSRLLEFLDAIMAIGYLSLVKTCVGLVGEMAQNLTAIAKLPSMNGISGKVQIVVDTARTVINAVLYGGKPGRREMGRLADQAERAERYLKAINRIPPQLNNVVRGFNNLKELKEDAEEKALGLIDSVINVINQFDKMSPTAMANAKSSGGLFDTILSMMKKIGTIKIDNAHAKTINYLLRSFIKFGRAASQIIISKATVEGIRGAFGEVARFSLFISRERRTLVRSLPILHQVLDIYGKFFTRFAKFGRAVAQIDVKQNTTMGINGALKEVVRFAKFTCKNRKFLQQAMPLVDSILSVYGKFFDSLGQMEVGEDKVGSIQSVFKTITEFNQTVTDENIGRSARLLNNYDTFLTRIDTLKLENLQTAVRIFEEMSRFSESINGNFEAMAETLNERIAPLMEELKETLNAVNEQVTEKSKPGKGELRTYDQTEDAMLKQNSHAFVGMNAAQKDQAIKSEMEKETKGRYGMDDIEQKLADLIDLFRSGNARVRHV